MGKKRKKTVFEESLLINQHTYYHYLEALQSIAMSRFEWKNLPDSVDERYIELKLFENGSVLYFNDDVIGNLCLSMIRGSGYTVYGDPVQRTGYSGYNRYRKLCGVNDSVIIWNNVLRTNSVLMCELYARKLWSLDRTIDVNCNAQKTPILLQGPESQKLSLQNLYKEYDGNAPVICAYDKLNTEGFKSITTAAPFVSDKIYEIKTRYWNEILTFLGIANVSVIKKERVNTDEVNRSLGGTYGCRMSPLKCRKRAAEKINKMFGTEIEVEFSEPEENTIGLSPDDYEVEDDE